MTNRRILALLVLAALLVVSACGGSLNPAPAGGTGHRRGGQPPASASVEAAETLQPAGMQTEASALQTDYPLADAREAFLSGVLPVYDGSPYVAVNGNKPFFEEYELTDESYETYSPLDALGRCGTASASVARDLMPTTERGSIREVRPSGWKQAMYDFVDGGALYNRCHLIGWQLTAEDANAENLITGTRYLNVQGMLPFENMVADYVHETGNHVAYRVTPVFSGDEPVARGVLMEGQSVEDSGEGVQFCVYAFNVQPGVEIDYRTGASRLASEEGTAPDAVGHYVVNTNTGKFHLPSCKSAAEMNPANRTELDSSRSAMLEAGYAPCSVCQP